MSHNLSETLFKPQFDHPETSTLVRRSVIDPLASRPVDHWYRLINRLEWIWRGIPPQDILDVQARIAMSDAPRTTPELYDTVTGYRSGNWIFEWSKQAMSWQQKAGQENEAIARGHHWLRASGLYSIAAYPHIKGDELAEQAQTLAYRAYQQAVQCLPGSLRELPVAIPGGSPITTFLHLPDGEGPFPVIMMCGSLDGLQIDYYSLYANYFAPARIAMLTLDMPSTGFSSKWKLTQETSLLHQHVLQQLPTIPWVDHTRVAAFGFRFGANVAVRLGYLAPQYLKAVACLAPVVHQLLTEPRRQRAIPGMYLDVLASRLGMYDASDEALCVELNRYSLKNQGLLGRRCPTPMLSGFWQNDPLSPQQESGLITASSVNGKLLAIPSTPVYHNFDDALRQITAWLKQQLA